MLRDFSDRDTGGQGLLMTRGLVVSAPRNQDIRDTGHQGLGR